MGTKSKQEYLVAILGRYRRAGRRYKSKILDEFCAVCGYHRKYAIRLLAGRARAPKQRPGPKPRYGAAVTAVLKRLWLDSDQLCSKRLQRALPLWLPYYEQEYQPLTRSMRTQLLAVSPATIDRLLRPARAQLGHRGLSGTKPGSLLKQHIPIRTDNDDADQPGFVEADAVAHCGGSLAGDFVWSLTFTDLWSTWTENRAVWNRGAHDVLARIKELEADLPFALRAFDVDNGAEFLNHHLWRYFCDRPQPIAFARSRPYHKDDQAHVEQKNWTHVRQLLGYDRLADPALVPLLNELYRQAWDPWNNFFRPSMKLRQKRRVNSRYVRHHDQPQTPYQRLLACPQISAQQKQRLTDQFRQLNPYALKKQIEQKLRVILARVRYTAK
ncbi:integrase [bacterium]|nr:integrase [bacterium]